MKKKQYISPAVAVVKTGSVLMVVAGSNDALQVTKNDSDEYEEDCNASRRRISPWDLDED